MTLDAELRQAALDLVEELGTTGTLIGSTSYAYNTATGTGAEVTPQTTVIPISPPVGFDIELVDGDLIRIEDLLVYVPASGLTLIPAIGMKLTITGGSEYRIIAVSPIYSGILIALYRLQLRL